MYVLNLATIIFFVQIEKRWVDHQMKAIVTDFSRLKSTMVHSVANQE